MRRSKGEGSITQLPSGKYRVRIETDPIDGKRHWLTAVVVTKTEATKKLKELQRTKEDNKYVKKLSDTYGDLVDSYLNYRKQDTTIKGLSFYTIERRLRASVSVLKDVQVQKLTSKHIEALQASYRDAGNSDSTIHQKIATINSMFLWAVKKKLILSNPIDELDSSEVVKAPKRRKRVEVLSDDEHKLIREYTKGFYLKNTNLKSFMYAIYLVAYETGMRISEIKGLKWSSVDLEKNTINVENNYTYSKNGDTTPKTPAGFRLLVISKGLADVLRALYEYNRNKVYVFESLKSHKPYTTYTIDFEFREILHSVGITRKLTFHDIRHTNASLMIHKRVPDAVIVERLGHSSITTTYNVYAHIYNEVKQRETIWLDSTSE